MKVFFNNNFTIYVLNYSIAISTFFITFFSVIVVQSQTYKAQFTAMSVPSVWCAGVAQNVTVTVTNNGTATWTDAGPDINIGCKWNAEADYYVRVNAGGLAPGASRIYTLTMTAPATPGSNNLTFDVVREGVCWYAWNSSGCGPGNSVYTSSAVTVQSASTAPTAVSGTTTICAGSSTTLTASGGTAGTGATFQWYADGCGTGSVLGTGASITVSPSTTTTYYIRRTNTCNTTACFAVTVNVNQLSNAGTFSNAGPINFCNGSGNFTTPVTVSGHTGNVVWDWGSNNGVWNNNWISGTSSGACCFPKQISNSDGTADRMRVRVTNGICPTVTSSTISIRELYNEAPSSLTSSVNNICAGISGTLTATFPSVINKRGTVEFFSGSCGSTLIASVTPTGGTTVSTSFTPPAGSTIYYARYNPGTGTNCSATACASVTVNVTPSSSNPTGISGNTGVCSGSSITLTQTGGTLSSGADYYWYEGTCASVFIQDWATQPYTVSNTTVNSITGSVLRVTSTSNDPMINMYSIGSFNPNIYKKIQTRYRVITGTAGYIEIFFTNGLYGTANGNQKVQSTNLINDGAWHVINIDMSTHANWTNSNVTGWRYDWATTSGVTMEIDYIMLESPISATGNSITVSPTVNTTYYVRAVGDCKADFTIGCVSKNISVYQFSGGTFTFTNPYTCGNTGTITVSGVSGGSGTYQYSRDNGANWQVSATFTNVPSGTHTILVRNSTVPYCETLIGTCTMYQPHSPIPAVPTVSNSGAVCPANTVTLTASGLEPSGGASNTNGAYTFNGTNQYLFTNTLTGFPTGSTATVEAWINPAAGQNDATYNGIVSFGPNPASCQNRFLMSIQSNGVPSFANWCNDYVPSATSCPALPFGQWSHLSMVLSGTGTNNIRFYINGQLVSTGTTNAAALTNMLANGRLTIGCTDPVGGRYFKGSIAYVRIWNTARTQAEIQADMYKEIPASNVTGLVVRYNFDNNINCQNNAAYNLTAVNAPTSSTPAFYTYTWSNNGSVPNPTASTNAVQTTPVQSTSGTFAYNVTAYVNSCSGTASNATNVLIHPLPNLSIIADYCYIGGKVLLTASSSITPATYVWSTGATTTDILVDIAGTYSVTAIVTATGCTATASRSVAEELVTNGDFSAGTGGFTTASQYTNQQSFYISANPSSGLYPEGKYAVNTWANSYHPLFFGADHTTGTGNFLMVNGSAAITPPVIWQQGPVTVLPNTDYYFSAWAVSLNNISPYAQLRFSVNGTQVGTTAVLTAGPSSNAGISQSNWVRFYGVWNSGTATTATISIVDNELAPGGNDFGLDDISFGTLSTFINLISATGTDAQTTCINSPIENIVYKVGSGPSGPVVTGLPPGISSSFNGINVTLSGTPTTAGTYNYTLAITGNCAPAYAYGSITVRGPQPSSTWIGSSTGTTATDWFDAKNWTDCVPGTITEAVIPRGRPSYPVIINTSTFDIVPKGKAKANTIDIGTTGTGTTPSLGIQSGSELRINE